MLRLAEDDFSSLLENEHWDAMELFLLTWGRTRYRDGAADGYREVDRMTAEAYGALLERLERHPREPFTLEQIASILQGLVEGLGFRHRVDPGALDGGDGAGVPASLYAVCVATLLSVMTAAPDDDRDLFTVSRAAGAGSREARHRPPDGPSR